jgi:hypothetical protein
MTRIRRWIVTVTLASGLALAGCTGSDDDTGSSAGGDDGGGAGIPVAEEAETEAPGAPIDIPSFQQDQGRPLADVLADIEGAVRDQCGGELCIEIVVEYTDEDRDECTFSATDPPQGGEIERGGTLVVIAGTQPCEDEGEGDGADGSDVDPDDGGSGDGTDDGGEAPDDGSGDTPAPDDGTSEESP